MKKFKPQPTCPKCGKLLTELRYMEQKWGMVSFYPPKYLSWSEDDFESTLYEYFCPACGEEIKIETMEELHELLSLAAKILTRKGGQK